MSLLQEWQFLDQFALLPQYDSSMEMRSKINTLAHSLCYSMNPGHCCSKHCGCWACSVWSGSWKPKRTLLVSLMSMQINECCCTMWIRPFCCGCTRIIRQRDFFIYFIFYYFFILYEQQALCFPTAHALFRKTHPKCTHIRIHTNTHASTAAAAGALERNC